MAKLYRFDLSTPANKVRFCANLIGIDLESVPINLGKGDNQTDEYLSMHPAGKVPVLDDDGFVLYESNAIMKYLCRKHDSDLYPQGTQKQALVDQWCDFVSAHVGDGYGRVVLNKIIANSSGMASDERSVNDRLYRFLGVVEGQLGRTKFLAGDELTIADICLLSTIDPTEMLEIDLGNFPKLSAWREDLRSQDFYQKVHRFYGESMMAPA